MRIKFIQKLIDKLRGRQFVRTENNTLAYNTKFIYKDNDASDIISSIIISGKPALICRFGTTELETVRQFLRHRKKKKKFEDSQRYCMEKFSGFFPLDDYNLTKFSCELINLTRNIDVLGCRIERFEEEMCNKFLSTDAKLIDIEATNSITLEKHWSRFLKGKKILVIHPFTETIKKQYAKRELLFTNPEILPEFELITLKAIQTVGDNKSCYNYATWFEALEDMKSKISKIDFDIAIIGAGAYGIFLADYCKQLGKIGIHLGGITQLLFGIKGKRWDHTFTNIYNEHWVRPSKEEVPLGADKIEPDRGGSPYW